MKKIDVVVCYNRKELVDGMERTLIEVKRATTDIEVNAILLDNTSGRFSSAASAYNYALKYLCEAECIVFCHQDILFHEGSLQTIYDCCMEEQTTLWGAAGIEQGKKEIITAWESGESLRKKPQAVQTLDECLIAANRKVFEQVKFDEDVCDGWHFYAVELSLQQAMLGRAVKVFGANIEHLSGGTMDRTFFECERKVAKKYRGKIGLITYTNCWCWTNPLLFTALRVYRKIRYRI